MRHYEIVYIFDPNLDEDAVNEKLSNLHPLLLNGDGEVEAVDHWGIRQFAYPIKDKNSGYYVVSQAKVASAVGLPEFERLLGLDETILRYLIVVNQGEPTTQESILEEVFHRATEVDEVEGKDQPEGGVAQEVVGPRGSARRRQMDGPPVAILNYKDVDRLSQFITEQAKILPKRTTKVSASFQRQLGKAIKRARFLALIPYVSNHEA